MIAAAPLLAAAGLVAAAAAASGESHPNSISRLEIRIEEGAVDLRFQAQVRTLLEVPRLIEDRNRDGSLSRSEWGRSRAAAEAYVGEALEIWIDGERAALEWESEAAGEPPMTGQDEPDLVGQIVFRARWSAPQPVESLRVRFGLFFEDGNPDHRVDVRVLAPDAAPRFFLLHARSRDIEWPPPEAPGVFLTYLVYGWEHVMAGLDHLAFVLALLLGVRGVGNLVKAVTAFTLAHSLTLALSALGWFALPPEFVEPGIALSIVFTAWLHAWQGPARARPWLVALPFGLLHGCGFAGVLGDIGLPAEQRWPALLAFNLGVELGQLTFVLPVAGAAALVARRFNWEAREALRLQSAAVIGAIGAQFTAASLREYWLPASFERLPPGLELLPLGLTVYGVTALWLRGRRTPTGESLLPSLSLSAALWVLYRAGRFLARLLGWG